MTQLEKRKRLLAFCEERDCNGCLLDDCCRCGRGAHFCTSIGLMPSMSDKEIDEAYDIVFGNNETDTVNRPAHYTDGKIEVIEFIEDKSLGYCLGNAIKYIARAGKKDPTKEIEDLRKAIWYLERRIKELDEARNA